MKRDRWVAVAGLLAATALVTAGCGGISGSHSVSPASFFLPGLMYHEPAVPATVPGVENPVAPLSPAAQDGAGPLIT